MFILWFSLHVPHVFISSLHLLAKCPQCLHFMHCVGSYFCFVGQTTSAKINISYSILFNLTTSYSFYFGGKKGISRNKTSFFLLMHSVWPSNRNRAHTLRVTSAALSQNGALLKCWPMGLRHMPSVLCKWKDDWQGMEGCVR